MFWIEFCPILQPLWAVNDILSVQVCSFSSNLISTKETSLFASIATAYCCYSVKWKKNRWIRNGRLSDFVIRYALMSHFIYYVTYAESNVCMVEKNIAFCFTLFWKKFSFLSLRVNYQIIFNITERTDLQSEYVKMWKCGNKTLSLDKPRNNKQQVWYFVLREWLCLPEEGFLDVVFFISLIKIIIIIIIIIIKKRNTEDVSFNCL